LLPPPNRKRKPRKDDAAKAASDLAEAETARAEEAAMRKANAWSLRDVVPTENSMSLDAALDWSRRDWEREEAEQQRRLLDLAAAQRRAAAAAQPTQGASVVKLEDSSDDDLYRPTPPRFGNVGQRSSRQASPPQDGGDSSDNGDDYMAFYRRLGM
jgi:phage repressor protein C with HTH and peptisase S24 domain